MLVLSDVHLSRNYGENAGHGLAALLASHRDCEIVLAGDVLDLTLDSAMTPVAQSISGAISPHIQLREALRDHVRAGGRLSFIPGNHDSNLAEPTALSHLRHLLKAENDHTVQLYPWFLRRGDIHIEHGHLYDPDCAPNHPLSDPNPSHEGLGNALMRRFVAPNNAFLFAHKNQTTMSSGVTEAFKHWGPQAPLVIARYFKTALLLWAEATLKKKTVIKEKHQGNLRLAEYALVQQVPAAALKALLDDVPSPTHHSGRELFLRLYFDRVLAATSLTIGSTLLLSAGLGLALGAVPLVTSAGTLTSAGAILSALGTGYLTSNVRKKKNRYGDAVIGQLATAAQKISEVTDARLVILGHSHVEVDETNYVNLGSFGYGRGGRPYLLIDAQGRREKKRF